MRGLKVPRYLFVHRVARVDGKSLLTRSYAPCAVLMMTSFNDQR